CQLVFGQKVVRGGWRRGLSIAFIDRRGGCKMFRYRVTQQLRFVEENDWPERAFRQFEKRGIARRRPPTKKFRRFPAEGIIAVCAGRGSERPFREREKRRAHNRSDGALRPWIELAYRFHGVAEQLDADGTKSFRRKNIDDSAAHGELPGQLDHFRARITHRGEMSYQLLEWNL